MEILWDVACRLMQDMLVCCRLQCCYRHRPDKSQGDSKALLAVPAMTGQAFLWGVMLLQLLYCTAGQGEQASLSLLPDVRWIVI